VIFLYEEGIVMKRNGVVVLTFNEKELNNGFVVLKILAAWLYLRVMEKRNCESEEIEIEGVVFPFETCVYCMDRRQCGYKTIINMKTKVSSSFCRIPNKNGLHK